MNWQNTSAQQVTALIDNPPTQQKVRPDSQRQVTAGASSQARVRAYNERLILALIRKHDALSKADLARESGLTAQALTAIIRSLEAEQLVVSGNPRRGKVGQPSVPWRLNPSGVYSLGVRIGRRSSDALLLDFTGNILDQHSLNYRYPTPDKMVRFVESAVQALRATLPDSQQDRICGLGIAMPFELWSWTEQTGAPADEMAQWKSFDLADVLQSRLHLPVFIENDATAACGAELVFGHGRNCTDFLYFFLGMFVGGGVVLENRLVRGRCGNAGALGSMPLPALSKQNTSNNSANTDNSDNRDVMQLVDYASLYALEARLSQQGISAERLAEASDDWSVFEPALTQWIEQLTAPLATAIGAACSVLEFERIVIDSTIPPDVLQRIVTTLNTYIKNKPLSGIAMADVVSGTVGPNARSIGSAYLPLHAAYLLDHDVLFHAAPVRY